MSIKSGQRRFNPLRLITLRSHLIVLVFVTMIPLFIFSAVMIYILAQRERATFQRGATERTLAVLTAVDTELKSTITTLEALATSRSLDTDNLPAFRDEVERVLKSQQDWFNINLAAASGQQVMNLLRAVNAQLPMTRERQSFEQVLRTGKPAIGHMVNGPVTERQEFSVRVPVVRDGVTKYVLSAVVNPDTIARLILAQRLPPDWVGGVVDGNQRIVARTVAPERAVGQLASETLRAELSRSPDGWFRGTTLEGGPVYTPYNRSAFSGWTVAIGIPAAEFETPLRGTGLYVIIFGVIMLGAGITLAWTLSSHAAGAIDSLVGLVKNLGLSKDPAAARDVLPTEVFEIEHLKEVFLNASRLIQERSEERDKLEEALRHDVTQRTRTEQFLQLQVTVSRALTELEDLKSATPKIVQAVCELTGWEVGAIWDVDRSTNELTCVAVWHVPNIDVSEFEAASRQVKFAPGVGLAGRVWGSGEPAWIPDVTTDNNFLRTSEAIKHELHAAVCFPIKVGADVLGVVECFSREIREVEYDCLQTLTSIGSQLGQFVERQRAALTLHEREARFAGLINSAMDAVIAVDGAQRVVLFNPAAEQMFSCAAAEALGSTLDRFIPASFRAAHRKHIETFGKTGVTNRRMGALGALRGQRADGEEFPIEASISHMEVGGEKLFTVILRDITERKQIERRRDANFAITQILAESPSLSDATPRILQTIGAALGWEVGCLWIPNSNANLLRCSKAWSDPSIIADKFVSVSYERTFAPGVGLPGRVWTSLKPAWLPDVSTDDNFPRASFAAEAGLHTGFAFPILIGEKILGIMEFFRREIREPDCDLLAMLDSIGSQIGQFMERKRAEEDLRRANEELENRVTQRTAELTKLNSDLLQSFTEREKLEDQLRQSQKMEAVGTLAAGVAHDFNNILSVILGYARELPNLDENAEARGRSLEAITSTAERGAALVKQLLAFARLPSVEKKPVDINALVEKTADMCRVILPKSAMLTFDLDPTLSAVHADQNQLQQILINLCVNARDAIAEDGIFSVRTSLARGEDIRARFREATGDYARIEVSDTGTGMDEATRRRIFEPFFTTKQANGRTGLGLSVVYGIVREHGGFIDVESQIGRGAKFELYLPLLPETAASQQTDGELLRQSSGAGETILIVEDEVNLLKLLKLVGEKRNFRVLTAADGKAAIEEFKNHGDEIDLVLLDWGLPGIGGVGVFRKLKELNPQVKVIGTTGYIEEGVRDRMLKEGVLEFLQKPRAPSEIFERVWFFCHFTDPPRNEKTVSA